ncbi:AMP-binding protein [Candidatus Pelagibacter sp.]|uniref:AMP-binding protein n=1 Tax=Candidatus Pelagibacter sp. TaxID=2024849 RepID=UPI003F86ED5E
MYNNKLSKLFLEICNKNPLNTAIQINKKKVSYKKLDYNSNKYKKFFFKNIKKKTVILIEGNKNIETYYSMLGAIKTPFAYSIIDPKIPKERFKKLIKNGNFFLLYSSKKFEKIKNIKKYKIKEILKKNFDNENKNKTKIIKDNTYIVFTSGSTGAPKGCCIGEESILSFINIWKKILKINEKKQKNFSQLNPLYFDNSIFDFYISIFTGSILSPINTDKIEDLMNVPKEILKANCNIWFSVPSLIIYLLNLRLLKRQHLKKLDYVIFGGEGFPKNKLKELWMLKKELINVYGPSECTCICSHHFIKKKDIFDDNEKFVPLGKISENFKFKILSKKNFGELLLFGKGVGNGYFQNIKETKNKFIKKHNKIIGYKTGDIIKKKNNKIFFIGRKDNQVKLMGHRIELEEIEKEISKLKNVKENIVTKSKNKNIEFLTAHIYHTKSLKKKFVENYLNKKLPYYMKPKELNFYRKPLKKNRNFKIDRSFYQNLSVQI